MLPLPPCRSPARMRSLRSATSAAKQRRRILCSPRCRGRRKLSLRPCGVLARCRRLQQSASCRPSSPHGTFARLSPCRLGEPTLQPLRHPLLPARNCLPSGSSQVGRLCSSLLERARASDDSLGERFGRMLDACTCPRSSQWSASVTALHMPRSAEDACCRSSRAMLGKP
ncbi:hypothetical protein FA09DRAFT_332770 [Tilletiopsis washingtonensis]|uniref:Uncharacterized protein n=1 Tax=Tilletiopsis washingtonensis TaxID=58919 RepID=A0A316YYW0_9BASI|nr:hypothetical protein FA09DRAFT_332770 [Tilletiopsis washingtonensis]PWN94647.1 hypothetical protein FA09DRAFT_332770 [Tilletiopsis washingtonensis]